ncbi:MAG TPA: MarR family transcriptional regulator [Ilumatobacteraceae bacterium]
MKSHVDDAALHHLGGHLAVIHRRVNRAEEASRLPHGLTPAQARVIRTLYRIDRPMQMGELAVELDVVPRSVTSLIDELEPLHLVSRQADPGDGRSVLVALTSTGQSLAPVLRAAHGRAVASVLTPLDPTEIRVLAELLHRVAHTPNDDATR